MNLIYWQRDLWAWLHRLTCNNVLQSGGRDIKSCSWVKNSRNPEAKIWGMSCFSKTRCHEVLPAWIRGWLCWKKKDSKPKMKGLKVIGCLHLHKRGVCKNVKSAVNTDRSTQGALCPAAQPDREERKTGSDLWFAALRWSHHLYPRWNSAPFYRPAEDKWSIFSSVAASSGALSRSLSVCPRRILTQTEKSRHNIEKNKNY